MPFLRGGRYLWTHFSQSFFDKNEKFLCSSERKFPEVFKTHTTFVSSPLQRPSMAHQKQNCVFFGTPCIYSNTLGLDYHPPLIKIVIILLVPILYPFSLEHNFSHVEISMENGVGQKTSSKSKSCPSKKSWTHDSNTKQFLL